MARLVFFLLCILCVAVTGCSWVGQTAGKAQAKIERKTQDLEQGYHRGYEQEKAKTAPQQRGTDAAEQPSF